MIFVEWDWFKKTGNRFLKIMTSSFMEPRSITPVGFVDSLYAPSFEFIIFKLN